MELLFIATIIALLVLCDCRSVNQNILCFDHQCIYWLVVLLKKVALVKNHIIFQLILFKGSGVLSANQSAAHEYLLFDHSIDLQVENLMLMVRKVSQFTVNLHSK